MAEISGGMRNFLEGLKNFRGVEKYSGGLRKFQDRLKLFLGGEGLIFFYEGLNCTLLDAL